MLDAKVVTDDAELDGWVRPWDDLAIACGRPFSSPAWLLPWWRCVASPAGHSLRVVIVHDGSRLAAIFPFWVERTRTGFNHYRLMGTDVCTGSEPLAEEGTSAEATGLAVSLLLRAEPTLDVIRLEGVRADSGWQAALQAHWPGTRPWVGLDRQDVAPFLDFAGRSYDDWFESKSTDFRKQLRRRTRRLNEQGFNSKLSTDLDDVLARLPAFSRLHRARWDSRGGSGALSDGADEMLRQVARGLAGSGRLRLWTLERDETDVISADVMLGAGGELSSWLGGFDAEWAALQPGILNFLAAIEHAWRSGEYRRMDLGAGAQAFKYRFTGDEQPVEWWRTVRRGWRPVHTPAQFVPWEIRRGVGRGVGRMRGLLHRGPEGDS